MKVIFMEATRDAEFLIENKNIFGDLSTIRVDIIDIKSVLKSSIDNSVDVTKCKKSEQDEAGSLSINYIVCQNKIDNLKAKFSDFHKKLEHLKLQNPYASDKLETVSLNLKTLECLFDEAEKDKSNVLFTQSLITYCDKVIGSVNKLLFPLYKRKALNEVITGGKISLLEPRTDLEGLNDEDIKFMIEELKSKKDVPGWFDLTDYVIYKAAETKNERIIYSIIPLLILLFGGIGIFLIFHHNLYTIINSSDIRYPPWDLILFYLCGILGLLVHFYTIIGGNRSRITSVDELLIWFSSRWFNFMGTVCIFWLGFLLIASYGQANVWNSILLGYSIDSSSEVILNRYGSLVTKDAKNISELFPTIESKK